MADKPLDTTKSESLGEKFKLIGKQIQAAAVDFTTLNVTTLTGNYNHIINVDAAGKKKVKTNFKDFAEQLNNKSGGVDANVKLVAHTHVDFDHDTVNFVSENVSNGDFLFDIHNAAINSAKTSRSAFIRMLKEFID